MDQQEVCRAIREFSGLLAQALRREELAEVYSAAAYYWRHIARPRLQLQGSDNLGRSWGTYQSTCDALQLFAEHFWTQPLQVQELILVGLTCGGLYGTPTSQAAPGHEQDRQ